MIGIIIGHTPRSSGQVTEFKCAIAKGVPLMLTRGSRDNSQRLKLLPKPVHNMLVHDWTAENIVTCLNCFKD